MKDLEHIVARIEAELDEKDEVREVALKSTRAIVRLAGSALRGMHRGDDVEVPLAQAREETHNLRALLQGHPDLWYGGAVEGALQEVAEAAIVHNILNGTALPEPRELGIPSPAYLLGLADAIGELRRFVLDHLRAGQIENATHYLEIMEDMFDALLRFDHPNAIVPLRRKQDIARGLVERTRGELAVAARGTELEKKLNEVARKL